MAVLIRAASLDEVLPLRALVLRDDGPLDSARFDEDERALHVAVLDPDVIACASVFRSPRPGDSLAWRIRGVAVHPQWRGQGLGEAAVRTAMELSEARSFWCSARLAAVGFWQHLGFTVEEDEPYELPHGGLHHTMSLRRT
jgi:ribosomal protein S18 acetylase RimI-like enzyme